MSGPPFHGSRKSLRHSAWRPRTGGRRSPRSASKTQTRRAPPSRGFQVHCGWTRSCVTVVSDAGSCLSVRMDRDLAMRASTPRCPVTGDARDAPPLFSGRRINKRPMEVKRGSPRSAPQRGLSGVSRSSRDQAASTISQRVRQRTPVSASGPGRPRLHRSWRDDRS